MGIIRPSLVSKMGWSSHHWKVRTDYHWWRMAECYTYCWLL